MESAHQHDQRSHKDTVLVTRVRCLAGPARAAFLPRLEWPHPGLRGGTPRRGLFHRHTTVSLPGSTVL